MLDLFFVYLSKEYLSTTAMVIGLVMVDNGNFT